MKPFSETDIRVLGPLKPPRFEAVVDDCIVEGDLPKTLNGGFYRCGPAWKRHTVQGVNGFPAMDGMVHGLILENGKARHINKWVRTPKYLLEEKHGRALFEYEDAWTDWRGYAQIKKEIPGHITQGVPAGTGIVNAIPFYARDKRVILSTSEQGLGPIAIDPYSLDTIGLPAWNEQITPGLAGMPAFTGHAKWDQQTGELFGWVYRETEPYVTLHFVQADGTVKSRHLEGAPYCTNAHDIWLTDKYVVMPFQPFYASVDRVRKQALSWLGWNPALPTRLALIPRDLQGAVRWVDAAFETQYIMHTMSANQRGQQLFLDGPIYDRAPFPFEDEVELGVDFVPFKSAVNGRWIVDLESGKVSSERLGEDAVEFPKVDERYYGRPYRNGFLVGGPNLFMLDTVIHRDVISGAEKSYKIPDEDFAIFEPTFAPRDKDAPEGDGYLIVPQTHYLANRSDYLIFDTRDITAGPIARVKLPFQTGWTPHGHWMDFS